MSRFLITAMLRLPAIAMALSGAVAVHAQHGAFPDKYQFVNYGQAEGLPQNSIKGILPDNRGYLWIATEAGVVRFDGKRFALCNNELQAGDVNGFQRRLISVYPGNKDTILALTTYRTVLMIVNNTVVHTEDYRQEKHGFLFGNGQRAATGGSHIPAVGWDESSGHYAGFPAGNDTFAVYLPHGFRLYAGEKPVGEVAVDNFLSGYAFYSGGYIVYVDNSGIASVYSGTRLVKKQDLGLPKSEVVRVKGTPGREQFLICANLLYSLKVNDDATVVLQPVLDNLERSSSINFIWRRNRDTYVVTTGDNGLYIYSRSFFTTALDTTPYASNSFYAQALLPDSSTILTSHNILFRDNRLAGTCPGLYADNLAMLADSKGWYWYGNQSKIYKSRDPRKGGTAIMPFKGGLKVLFEDRYGYTWISVSSELGYWHGDKYTPVNIAPLLDKRIGLVECMAERNNGDLLLGTTSGILQIKRSPGSSIMVSRLKGWEGQDVRFIKAEADGNVWICTYGNGFYLLRNNASCKFPQDEMKKLAYVHSIIEDDNHYFWLPTNNGIFVAARQALLDYADNKLVNDHMPFYYYFDKSSGLASNEFNGGCQPSFISLPGRRFSLPSIKGLVSFQPGNVSFDLPAGNISIEKVKADTMALPLQDRYILPRGVHAVSFTIASPYWGKQENNTLQYCVIHAGADVSTAYWLNVDASMNILLSGLKHDDYKLLIRQRTGFLDKDFVYREIYFSIPPRWYQSGTFFISAAVAALLLLLAAFRLRTRLLKKKNLLLQEKIYEATATLQDTNSNLSKNIQIRNQLISIFTHDISAPLQYISVALDRMRKKEQLTNDDKAHIGDVFDASRQLNIMAGDLIQWIKVQQGDKKFHPEIYPFNLKELLIEKWNILRTVAEEKGISLKIENEEAMGCEVVTDRKILGIIFYNLFSNAIKFTKEGTVTLAMETSPSGIIVSVTDTGRGFSPEQLQRIKNMLEVQPQSGTDNEIGKGMGLRIIRDLGEAINVRIAIDSKPGRGSRIKVLIPAVN